jgi:hypothetical protein
MTEKDLVGELLVTVENDAIIVTMLGTAWVTIHGSWHPTFGMTVTSYPTNSRSERGPGP